MVDANDGLVPEEGEHARGYGDGLEGRAHPRAFGVADAVDVRGFEAGFDEGTLHERDDMRAVVYGGVFGEETGAGGGDVGVSEVGEDYGGRSGGGVRDDANADFVGAAFEADCVAHG